MPRGITLRTLLVALVLGTGLLVLFMALSGVADAVRDAGGSLDWVRRYELERSLLSTQFVRGVIGLILAAILAGAAGGAASRLLAAARPGPEDDDVRGTLWLREARDLADAEAREEEARRERLETIHRERADLDRLLEAVSEGILHLDAEGRVVRANRAARRLLSLPDDAEGRQIGAVVRSAELRGLLQRAAAERTLPPQEVGFEDRTLIITVSPLTNGSAAPSERAAALAVAVADLTAVRRLESVRRDFVANASHELKTPLTSIRGYAETLLDDDLPAPMRRQFIETIFSNADRLQRIVDDLLDLSRLESGRWQPDLDALDPAELAHGAWADFAERARQREVSFDVAAPTPAAAAMADPSALHQILSNLYDNALRYTPAGGAIRVRIARLPARERPAGRGEADAAGGVVIEVADTGTGIASDALPRIFERFYRVDPARSRAEGGTGLGLSIVKHLAESMGGSVEAESRLGRGTTIRVLLPAASAHPADEQPSAGARTAEPS